MTLYIMDGLECVELTVGNSAVERLDKHQGANNVDIIVGVYYRPVRQDNDISNLIFEELKDTSKSTALVLMGKFDLPEINWECHTAGTTWAIKFLKELDNHFMEQVLSELTEKGALLDLFLVNRVDLVGNVVTGAILATATQSD